MNVEASHHVDCSDIGPDGYYDYYYAYTIWRFSDGGTRVLIARGYDDETDATLNAWENPDGTRAPVRAVDLFHPLVRQAMAHLRGEGRSVQRLSLYGIVPATPIWGWAKAFTLGLGYWLAMIISSPSGPPSRQR
ncbi:hypothetical protein FBZ89_104209 [Nitrospirillum amazonense]|uniref:Uncharacterized protein n=1 Tax=Nitrospirillum amazonense TaxID=28077 RepID=A0A560FK22_9PROT|nr:hypothetical protein [Nitrospirillum amazonense]TWB21961.1 hypothetical protein FBZ89_104209 [Nitrospirillum amazonense]